MPSLKYLEYSIPDCGHVEEKVNARFLPARKSTRNTHPKNADDE